MRDLIVYWPVDEKVLPYLGGCPALPAAAEKGCLEAVEFLLKEGADPKILKLPDKLNASQLARANGYPVVADIIDRYISTMASNTTMSQN